ncbi:MAG: retropepsin-like aspartic protease [Terriglobia bacterium]
MKGLKHGLLILASLLISQTLLAADGLVEVPFRLYRGYVIVVKGSIAGLDKLNFLIDTGAVPSVVDRRIAQKLKLSGNGQSLSVFSQSVQAQGVVLSDVALGPIRAERLPVLVRDLAFIEEGMGIHIDAMVGLDVLARSSFRIDYQSKKMIFGAVEPSEYSVVFEPRPGYVLVQFEVEGQPLRLVVDTGAKDVVLFESRVHGRLASVRTAGAKTSANMGGESQLQEVRLPTARLGTTDLGNQKAYLLATSAQALPNFDGLLGVTALGVKRLAFDFDRQTISWQK